MSTVNRRELLAAFLGAPTALALGGCSQRAVPELPPGKLVGGSVSVGHQLLDESHVSVIKGRPEKHRVVIVGGGIAGLSAARRLLRAGVDDFVVIELEPEPGGTSRSGESDLVAYPWGAHYVPAPTKDNPALVDLLQEMGVFEGRDDAGDPIVAEQFLCRYPQERVFYKGYWHEGLYMHAGATTEDLDQLEKFKREIDFWVGWRDGRGRRAFAIPMANGSDDAEVCELDRMSMADWLEERGLTSPRLRWFVDYACRDDYGSHADETSAWAGLFYFASRVPEPGAKSRPFITWPEGNGRLVEHLYAPVRQKTRLGLAVVDIAPRDTEGPPEIRVLAVPHEGRTAQAFQAEKVIFAAPYFLAPYIVRFDRENQPAHVREFEYGAWAVANLILKEIPYSRGAPLAWDNVLYESPSLGYVATTYQRGLDHGPALLTYYYALCDQNPRIARARLLEVERDGWAEIALSDLERAHPGLRSQTSRIDVMRWGHAMILPRPRFIWGGAREAAATAYRGIHFAHSDLSGLPLLEEAFYRGTLAAEQVLEEIGKDIQSVL
jgi:protoporphyrinogen oxidase